MTEQLVQYNVDEAALAAVREKCALMTADTTAGYEEVRLSIANLRDTRTSIEKRRVELKADALAWGRKVDSEAGRLTLLVTQIEAPLKEKKDAVDNEKARLKAEAEAAKLAALQAEIAANLARQEAERHERVIAEEARIAKDREALEYERAVLAEERRLADEARAEALAAESKRLAERREAERIAREAEDAKHAEENRQLKAAEDTRLALEHERLRVHDIAQRAEAKRLVEERRLLEAERDRLAALAYAEAEALEVAARKARLEALRPDAEKLEAFAATIRALEPPTVTTNEALETLGYAMGLLNTAAVCLTALEVTP